MPTDAFGRLGRTQLLSLIGEQDAELRVLRAIAVAADSLDTCVAEFHDDLTACSEYFQTLNNAVCEPDAERYIREERARRRDQLPGATLRAPSMYASLTRDQLINRIGALEKALYDRNICLCATDVEEPGEHLPSCDWKQPKAEAAVVDAAPSTESPCILMHAPHVFQLMTPRIGDGLWVCTRCSYVSASIECGGCDKPTPKATATYAESEEESLWLCPSCVEGCTISDQAPHLRLVKGGGHASK